MYHLTEEHVGAIKIEQLKKALSYFKDSDVVIFSCDGLTIKRGGHHYPGRINAKEEYVDDLSAQIRVDLRLNKTTSLI